MISKILKYCFKSLKKAIFMLNLAQFLHPMHHIFFGFSKTRPSIENRLHEALYIVLVDIFPTLEQPLVVWCRSPKVKHLRNAQICPFQQLCGRSSNKCCFLATNVAFCETSSLKSSKFVLNFVRSQNIASLKSYHFLKFCKFLDFHRPKSLSLSWRRKG